MRWRNEQFGWDLTKDKSETVGVLLTVASENAL